MPLCRKTTNSVVVLCDSGSSILITHVYILAIRHYSDGLQSHRCAGISGDVCRIAVSASMFRTISMFMVVASADDCYSSKPGASIL